MVANRQDTVQGTVRVEDADGIDSVWITLESVEKGEDGGFNSVFSSGYIFIVGIGFDPGEQLPLTFRARDIAGFVVQRDTYVVVGP